MCIAVSAMALVVICEAGERGRAQVSEASQDEGVTRCAWDGAGAHALAAKGRAHQQARGGAIVL